MRSKPAFSTRRARRRISPFAVPTAQHSLSVTIAARLSLLGFGYTSCHSVCPATLAVLAQAHRQAGALGSQVQVIYLTVDPERDSAERLKQFLAAFDPSFVGGTGSAAQMAAVRASYGVTAEKVGTGSDYGIAHSSFIYLITREGKLRALMPFGHKADDYVHDISMLLN